MRKYLPMILMLTFLGIKESINQKRFEREIQHAKVTVVVDSIVYDTTKVIVKDTVKTPIKPQVKVTLTCYQPLEGQCNSDPLTTADGSHIDLSKLANGDLQWVAVSRDLLKHFPKGSKIHINGYGDYEVHDVMNKRWTKRVDILIHPSSKQRIYDEDVIIAQTNG